MNSHPEPLADRLGPAFRHNGEVSQMGLSCFTAIDEEVVPDMAEDAVQYLLVLESNISSRSPVEAIAGRVSMALAMLASEAFRVAVDDIFGHASGRIGRQRQRRWRDALVRRTVQGALRARADLLRAEVLLLHHGDLEARRRNDIESRV